MNDSVWTDSDEAAHQKPAVAQAALVGDILAGLAEEQALDAMLARCAEAVVGRLGAAFARVWTLDAAADVLELQASAGMYTHLDGDHSRVPVGHFKIGRIAEERAPHLTNDVLHDPRISDYDWARREGMVAFAGYPLLAGDQLPWSSRSTTMVGPALPVPPVSSVPTEEIFVWEFFDFGVEGDLSPRPDKVK